MKITIITVLWSIAIIIISVLNASIDHRFIWGLAITVLAVVAITERIYHER
jgi:hypothetical protein